MAGISRGDGRGTSGGFAAPNCYRPRTISRRHTRGGPADPLSGGWNAGFMTSVLAGRAAVIAGASEGLGLEIALAYVRAGASVLLCARTGETLERAEREVSAAAAPSQQVLAVVADVAIAADVDRVAATALHHFPQVHALVNNAGVYGPFGPIESIDWN